MGNRERKEELRQSLLKQREDISEPDFYGKSAIIIKKLKEQFEYEQAHTIHSYVSMNARREVETHELIKEMIRKGNEVVVPITNTDKGTLSHILLDSFYDLEKNKWGVLEPRGGTNVDTEELDLVVVPMVGGDHKGNRIGYGKGFYDRFLKDVQCPKIGLLFDVNIVEDIPTEEFDIPLDKIITEKRIINRD